MSFDSCEFYQAIKNKGLDTPERTLKVIQSGSADIFNKNETGETFYHHISHCYIDDEDAAALLPVVFQLGNAGIDVNCVDEEGNTALHVAAPTSGTRKLLRALLMVGADPNLPNTKGLTALKLAKGLPDNVQILNFFSPGLWTAIEKGSTDNVVKLLTNWAKIDYVRDGQSLLDLAASMKNDDIFKVVRNRENTVKLVHHCMAGDRQGMRPLLKLKNITMDTFCRCHIDDATGELVNFPLIGETALLGLPAVFRKLLRKKADISIAVKDTPLYLYIMQNIKPEKPFYDVLEIMFVKFDFSKKSSKETMAVLEAAYDKQLPMDLLRIMVANGLDIFHSDKDGHFLRDLILIKNGSANPRALEKELGYVDNILIDMAYTGYVDMLQGLVEQCYEHVDVSNEERSVRQGLRKTLGIAQTEAFFEDAIKIQRLHRDLIHVIQVGHLAQFQAMINPQVVKVRDKLGRTVVYMTVLYERRHMFRHLLKLCPTQATVVDRLGRSPLHWACAQEEGDDIEAALKALGCKLEQRDESGISALDIKGLTQKEKQAMLEVERSRDPGLDTYLFFKYQELKEAIRQGDLTMLEEIRAGMHKDIPTKEITRRMFQTSPPQKCILQFAIEAKRDAIGKFLLTLGMDWDVKYKEGKEEISMLEMARRQNLPSVVRYIEYQIETQESQKKAIQKLKNRGVVKNEQKQKPVIQPTQQDTDNNNGVQTPPEDDLSNVYKIVNVNGEAESKSCSVQ